MITSEPEYWLQGPLLNVPALLQPVAHALLQARREINELMYDFPDGLLWQQPAGTASPAFHLQHITGVLDRLFTYAADKMLDDKQLAYLLSEGKQENTMTTIILLKNVDTQIDKCISFLKQTDESTLTQTRYVGRKKIASTQLGLLFHAAEHTMRHNGQLQVTVKVILAEKN